MSDDKMIDKRSWEEFSNTGLLVHANSFLHLFGWSIVREVVNGETIKVYPARVKFRGFDERSLEKAHLQTAEFILKNSARLFGEAREKSK